MASRKLDSVVSSNEPNTFRPTTLAPGATPSIRMLHAVGIGLGAEVLHVVDVDALARDRVGVEERLVAAGDLARPVAGEVLVVPADRGVEHRLAVGADEVDVVRVEPVGDPGHLHAGAGDAQRAGGLGARVVRVDVHQRQALGVQLNLAVLAAGAGDHVGRQRGGSACRPGDRRGGVHGRRRGGRGWPRAVDGHVGDDLGHRRVGLQPRLLARGHRGRERVDQPVRLDVAWRAPDAARPSSAPGRWRSVAARAVAAALPTCAAASWLFMITITWRFTFLDSWAASAGVIGAVAMSWAAGAATATADWPTTRAGTAAAAAIREMTLLLACARSVAACHASLHAASSRGRPRVAAVGRVPARSLPPSPERAGLPDDIRYRTLAGMADQENFVLCNFSITKMLA